MLKCPGGPVKYFVCGLFSVGSVSNLSLQKSLKPSAGNFLG